MPRIFMLIPHRPAVKAANAQIERHLRSDDLQRCQSPDGMEARSGAACARSCSAAMTAIRTYEMDLYRRLADAGLHGAVIPEPLVRYRVRAQSMARTVADIALLLTAFSVLTRRHPS